MALEGNYNNLNRRFNLGDLSVSAEVSSVFHVGINKKINSKWTVGLRGKIYSSIVQASSTENYGSFTTVEGTSNFLTHRIDLDMKLQTSGLSFATDSTATNQVDILKNRLLLGGNLGVGIDVGFTHEPSPEWTIDASLQDLGFINYSKDVQNYEVNGYLEYEGIQSVFPPIASDQTAQEYWDEVNDDFEDLFKVDSTTTAYIKWRPE